MSYAWIHPPLKIDREEFQTIYDSAYVEIEREDIPESDLYRYTDSEGEFYEQEDEPETIYGYYLFVDEDDAQGLSDPRAASACVETRGATFFSVGGHCDTDARSNLGNVAERGELYIISLADYRALAAGTPSTYLLDHLNTDRSSEDPYLWAKEALA